MLPQKSLMQMLLIILVGSCIYANSLSVPFTFDDVDYIVNNLAIKSFDYFFNYKGLAELNILPDAKYNFVLRPVAYLTFALNYQLHGLELRGYHLVNVLLHLANALLFYRFFVLLLSTPYMVSRLRSNPTPLWLIEKFPLVAALLFVAHPLQTQAVTYIVQRFVPLATFFILGALVLYAKARLTESVRRRRFFCSLSFIATVLAMQTKEIAFTLPIVLVLFEVMFFTGRIRPRLVRLLPFLATMTMIPWTVISLASGAHPASAVLVSDPTNLVNFAKVSRWDYLLTQFGVIVTYLRLLIVPVRQNFDYDYPLVQSFATSAVLFPLLLLVLLLGTALYLWRQSVASGRNAGWYRLIAFGLSWFFVTVAVESSIIPLDDLLVEHRVYLPSIGIFLALSGVVALLGMRIVVRPLPVALLGGVLVAALSVGTIMRNRVWADNVSLWQDVIQKSPNKARGFDHLSFWLTQAGRNEEAVTVARRGIVLAPVDFNLQMHLGAALTSLDRLSEAVAAFEQAVIIRPNDAQAYANLATVRFRLGEIPSGRQAMQTAVALQPDLAGRLQLALGIALTKSGQSEVAVTVLQQAAAVLPNDPQIHNNLATAYLMSGNLEAGRRSLLQAIAIDPNYGSAHYNLGCLLENEGRIAEAMAELQLALRSNANDPALQARIDRLRRLLAR